jgi:hypothetical protein
MEREENLFHQLSGTDRGRSDKTVIQALHRKLGGKRSRQNMRWKGQFCFEPWSVVKPMLIHDNDDDDDDNDFERYKFG